MTPESEFRLVVLISIAVTLPIGAYFRVKSQATREKLNRSAEGLIILIGLRLFGLLGLIATVAYLMDANWITWAAVALPHWLRWVGAILAVFAVPSFLFWTFRSLGKNLTDTVVTRREHTLVTHGPYRWVRHPFYDVLFLWVLSFILVTGNWILAVVGFGAFAMLVVRTRKEEEKLIERFGHEYRTYMDRTGRFVPRRVQ